MFTCGDNRTFTRLYSVVCTEKCGYWALIIEATDLHFSAVVLHYL